MLLISLIFEFCAVIVQAGCTPWVWCVTYTYSLMRGRIKGPRPLVNPMQSDNTFITHVIKILHGNSTPKAITCDLLRE